MITKRSEVLCMQYTLKSPRYQFAFETDGHTARIAGGHMGGIPAAPSPLFTATLKNTADNRKLHIDTLSHWEEIQIHAFEQSLAFYFHIPSEIEGLTVMVKAAGDQDGITWQTDVSNANPAWSVMEITYPTPLLAAEECDLFLPLTSGLVLKNAGQRCYQETSFYPFHQACMQYFALYNARGGVYIGIEDGRAAVKRFDIRVQDGMASIQASFFGINGGKPGNSFSLFGAARWQAFAGDWYDATMLYAKFVHAQANWLPPIGEQGRLDTPAHFQNVPFWVCDYIPNSASQGDNRPMNLSAGSDKTDPGYWYQAVIDLQEALGVPIAYHVYNWHEIPFNIEYPHFLPAKTAFAEGVKKLREHDVYILPYINAVSWEMHDEEGGHAVTFRNTGCHGAVLDENGEYQVEDYPQKTRRTGKTAKLAPMCPTWNEWGNLMEALVREMERTLDIDGVYFDQISATPSYPCYNPEHTHLPGGGDYWVEGYTRMMDKIRMHKPADSFYFSECNAEPYLKSFDGFLTWMWVRDGEVPAFSAIYAGYTQMLGRCTIGRKKEDFDFFKYCTANSLLYGQQIGWCKADVLFDTDRLSYLKQLVQLRYQYTSLFRSARMLRPPVVTCDAKPVVTSPALWFKDDLVMEQVLAGAWQARSGERLVIFLVNNAERPSAFSLAFPAAEYALERYRLSEDCVLEGDTGRLSGTLQPLECRVWEWREKDEPLCSTP